MQEVLGNTLGLKPSQLHALRRTYRRRVEPEAVGSPGLARHPAESSRDFRAGAGLGDEAIAAMDGKFAGAFVRARKPRP